MLVDEVLQHVDEAGLVNFLQRLVATPSVFLPEVPGANEEAAARLVHELLLSWGWQPMWQEVAPGRPNVIAELVGPDGPGRCLLFEGHTDVVTPGDESAWTHPPFGGEVVGGRLYGRGAADMKGGLAAMLFAARAIQVSGVPFRGRIRLAVPVDEEGLMLGIKGLVGAGHADGVDGAIVCEPEGREVCIAQKGSLRLRLLAHGRIAHGAMPDEGVNALRAMVGWLGRVLALEERLHAELGTHPLLGRLHITPTVARAPLLPDPVQMNCLPAACDAYLDIRSLPSLSHGQLIGLIETEAEALRALHPEYRFETHVIDDRPPTETPAAHPLVQAVLAGHQHVYGETALFGGVPGSTDGTILWRERGIPVVVYGPGDKRIPHQPDEWVELAEVVRAARVYVVAALTFFTMSDERGRRETCPKS
ncbi:MAG: M20 family metallopeptidase [Chloroflexaceae bacterium]|jgi:succinyl-diaminopimelate desuccinylase|nr:M20 family metallopeptidase [Chloroflexaceae bacterium]